MFSPWLASTGPAYFYYFRTAKVGVTYIPPSHSNPPLLAGAKANLFDIVVHMHGLGTFEEERKNAIFIKLRSISLPVLPLDRAILPVLREELQVIEDET